MTYAKIFAEGDEALSTQLSSIVLGKAVRSSKRSIPGEKRKKDNGASPQKQKRNASEENKVPVAESV